MAISELQNIRNELARIRSGGAVQSPTAVAQTNLQKDGKNNGGVIGGVGYVGEKLGLGAMRSIEGITDFVVGGVADIFGADEFAERLMKNDWVNYSHADEWYDPGKGMSFVGDIAQGVGGMLPAIAVSVATGGAALPATAAFTLGAAGQATSESTKESGELTGREWLYGSASGAAEGAIEAISGGIGGTAAGKVLGKQLGKSTLGKIGISFLGEGLEEVASDVLDPALKKWTGLADTYEAPTAQDLGRTFLVGGATGAVMGGLNTGLSSLKVGGVNNLRTAETAQELTERQADSNVRQAEGKKVIYTQEDIARTKENLSKRLQKMDSNTRAQFLKANANIANQFNEDGTVKTAIAPDAYNTNAYSASLQGREGSFAYKPITETSNATAQAKQVMDTLTKITDGKTNIVLTEDALTTESGKSANGLYQDGVIYLNAKATDYDKALKVGIHEVVHGLEGTKEYNELAKYISQQIKNDPDLAQRYNIDAYRNAYDKLLKGEWTEDTKDYQAATEIFADYIGNVVAENKTILNNLVARNSNVFVRFLNWVRNSIAKLGESAEERKMRKDLQTLEKMLVEALQAGNGGITLEEVEELSKSAEKARKAQDGNIQSVKFGENKNADGKLATARYNVDTNVFEIGKDSELAQRIANSDKSKYTVIKEYLVEKFGNTKFTLSDGKKAIMDNSDAEKLKYNADNLKVAELSNLKNLVEKAEYIGDPKNVTHRKFDAFSYYKITVSYDGNKFDILINVGRAKNDGVYHIYTITKYNEKGAVGLLKNNPSGPVGNRIKDGSFDSIITEKTDLSSENAKKVEKTSTSRKSIDVEYANAIKDGDTALAQKMVDQAAKEAGYDKKRFHETKEENIIHVFNLDLNTNASADYGTPFGVFTKSHNRSVGLGGKQMSLYVKADRTFSVKDRTETPKRLPQEYSTFVDKINAIDAEYDAKYVQLSDNLLDSFAEWLDENDTNDEMRNAWDVSRNLEEQFGDVLPQELIEKERKFLKVSEEWNKKTNQAILDAKKWLTKWLRDNGYDSMELEFDNGAGNRVTDALIVLDKEQVKSAEPATYDDNGNLIPLSKRFNKKKADIRYSLPVDIEADVKKYYGSTYRWNETGYILQDGTRLDLSGRNEGSGGGYRQVDHRDIFGILEDGPYGTEAMVEFIAQGNIRVIPETPGINLQVEPNAEQYRLIQDFVERVGWKEGYFSVDIDNKNGDTIETLTYEGKPSGRKVVADLKYYFKEGKVPYKSNLSAFRYSLNLAETYTSKQVANVIDDVVDMLVEIGEIDLNQYDVQVYGKDTLARRIADRLNAKATTSTKTAAQRAEGFIDEILDKVRIAKTDAAALIDAEQTLNFLRKYYHSMDLRSVKSDINNERHYNLFSGGEKAMAWDSVLQEIVEMHPDFEMDTDIETLLNVMDAYENARNTIRENKVPLSKIVLDLGFAKQMMKEQLKNSLEGNATTYKKVKKQSFAKELEVKKGSGTIDAELDKKTTERVQTAVSNMTMAERWKKAWDAIQLGKADQWIKAQIAWTDEQAGIIAAGRNLGVVMHGEVQRARVAKASAINMLNNEQRDYSGTKRVGDSLKAIFKPIQSRGKKVAQAFNLYLLHQLNVDRMSAVETADRRIKALFKANPMLEDAVNGQYEDAEQWRRAVRKESGGKEYLELLDVENKPVFEEKVDKAFSLEKIKELEKQYPEFKATAEKVWNYNQNLLQYRVDAGLITQEQADKMTEMYPHYVPAFYEKNGGSGTSGAFVGQKGIAVKTGIKSAKGSTGVSDIKDVQASIAKQTVAVVRAASINKIVEKLYDGAVAKGDFTDIDEVGREKMTDPDVDYDKDIPKNNEVFFYKDGERITLAVTQYVDAGFRGLTAGAQLGDPLTTLSAKAISLFKKLVTSYNPLFAVTNTLRDAQEAVFYTKYPKRFFANYGKALVTRKSDTRLKELWEQYKAMGGAGSGYFSQDTGVFDDRSKLRRSVEWLGDKMQIVNEWVEQAPRFAEFVASVEAGNSLEQALYDSAEVTTNFSRGGKMAKALNRHLIPFLNPSIQGWSKMWRGWVAPMDGKSAAEIERLSKQSKGRRFLSNYGALMFKAILCGVSVGLFNDMLYRWIDDDEDYANLPLNIKENYYLIKVGKKFIKIPKGRVVALYGSVWTRLSEAMNGNEDALNAWDWAKSASEMVSPLESAFRSIIAPVRDVQTNTTWYGGQIENASMENLAPSERYDEGTSKIAIAMGKAFNYSPKKIHYILDQYSGVIGDVILPLTTNKAEKNMVSARFVVDPLYNSDVSTKYYDYKEELTFAKNSGDTNATLMLKYMNEVQDDLSKMYQQKRDIANDKSLTNKEKREQTEIIQGLINATLSSSVDMADEFEQALIDNQYEQAVAVLTSSKAYTKLDEKSQTYASNKMNEYYYEMCKAEVSGTKPSMKYALYTSMNAPDLVVYLSNINNIEADKDKKGNTISGSRKEKVHKYIQGLRLSAQQKNILMYLAGYKPTEAGQKTVEAYLTKQGYTAKEVEELWSN